MLGTHVTLSQEWQSGSKLTPAPYEKAQTAERLEHTKEYLSNTYAGWTSQPLALFHRAEVLT